MVVWASLYNYIKEAKLFTKSKHKKVAYEKSELKITFSTQLSRW